MTISETLLVKLKDTSLAVDKGLVGGRVAREKRQRQDIRRHQSATGEAIATLPDMGRAETAHAIDAAHAAQKNGRKRPARNAPRCCATSRPDGCQCRRPCYHLDHGNGPSRSRRRGAKSFTGRPSRMVRRGSKARLGDTIPDTSQTSASS